MIKRPGAIALSALTACVVVAALIVVGWFLYWHLAESSQNHRYEVNTHSQQYQAALVSQERDRVQGFDAAVDPGQKANIKATFCAAYRDVTQPPDDLLQDVVRICD